MTLSFNLFFKYWTTKQNMAKSQQESNISITAAINMFILCANVAYFSCSRHISKTPAFEPLKPALFLSWFRFRIAVIFK